MFAPEKSVQNKTLSVDTGLHLGYIFPISSYGDEKSSPPKPSYWRMRALLFSEGVTLCHCICLWFGRCLAARQAGVTTLRLRPKAFRFGRLFTGQASKSSSVRILTSSKSSSESGNTGK